MNQRFYSLDVFRGATVALMILVNIPVAGAIFFRRWSMQAGMALRQPIWFFHSFYLL